MVWVAIVKAVAMAYAARGSFRASFAPGLVLVLSAVVTVALPIALRTGLVGGELTWWIAVAPGALALSAGAGAVATRSGFAELDRAQAGSTHEEMQSDAAYGLLANTLFDAALLVIALLALVLSARDDGF